MFRPIFIYIYLFILIAGTIYLSKKGNNALILENDNQLGISLTNTIDTPKHMHELILRGRNKEINIGCSVSIDLLAIEFDTKLIITNGSIVNINRIITSNSQKSTLSFQISSGSSLIIHSNILLNDLNLSGYMEVNKITIFSNGNVNIYKGAILNISQMISHASVHISIDDGTTIGSDTDAFNLNHLQLGANSNMILNIKHANLYIKTFILKSFSSVTSTTLLKRINLECDWLTMEYFAKLDYSFGGLDYIIPGNNNQSITIADSYGYGLHNNPGGGIIRIKVQNEMVLDGYVSVEGIYGGSIHIESDFIRGYGSILACGKHHGSIAGSGGKVSIVVNASDFNIFRGKVLTNGGKAIGGNGASGVFYLDHLSAGIRARVIRVHNEGIHTTEVTMIAMPPFKTKLEIKGESLVSLVGKDVFEFDRIFGDRSATLRIQADQTIILAKSFGISVPFLIPFRVEITEFGKIHLPARVMIAVNGNSKRPSFLLNGGIIDAGEFTIARNAYVKILNNVYNQRISGEISPKGQLTLKSIYLYSNLDISSVNSSRFLFKVKNNMNLYTGSVLSSFNLKVIAKNMRLSYGSEMTANAVNDLIIPVKGAFSPQITNFGAPGIGIDVTAGGGIIVIEASSLYLDGKISAIGGASDIAGAGGSISITADTINGLGVIDVSGGEGGGSGGSIFIDSKVEVRYLTLFTNGGTFANKKEFASAGWSFIKDYKDKFPYSKFIMDNIGLSNSQPTHIVIDSFILLIDEVIIGNNVNFKISGTG